MKYRTIVADPPWPIARPGNPKHPPYAVMQIEELKLLQPQRDVAAESGHLYLWTTQNFVCEARAIAEAWGFFPITLVTWVKNRFGTGHRFRSATEFFWFCERGPEKFNFPRKNIPSWFNWPQGGHSVKPAAFYDLVEEISPGPYLEMFARHQRFGWDTWGNEALEHVSIA